MKQEQTDVVYAETALLRDFDTLELMFKAIRPTEFSVERMNALEQMLQDAARQAHKVADLRARLLYAEAQDA